MSNGIPSFRDHIEIHKKESSLSTVSTNDLKNEISNREKMKLRFPLEVFHQNIKPYIQLIHEQYDIPDSFIGLSLLTTYSSAIGNGYWITNKRLGSMPLTIWSCIVGMSSSGKSIIMKQIFEPLKEIQREYSRDWQSLTGGMVDKERELQPLKKLEFNDILIPTLIRSVLPDNPKGLIKYSDEILEWINGMNPYNKKEGNEEQFWLKCWDGSSHQITRAGKQETFLEKMFINNFGSIQPTVLHKLFKNDRDTTGFIFRLLFAIPEENRVSIPSLEFEMPQQLEDIHNKCINSLYRGIAISSLDQIRSCIFESRAIKLFDEWRKLKASKINHIESLYERNLQGGIYGKINAYTLRFSAILHLADKAYNCETFDDTEKINEYTVERAIKLGDYFFNSACVTHDMAKEQEAAPAEVTRVAILWSQGKSYSQIGQSEWPNLSNQASKKKAERLVKKNLTKYPRLFKADTKR